MDKTNKIADRAEAYHRLKKQLQGKLSKKAFKEQEEILDEQWWTDVCTDFGWKDIKQYYDKRL